MGDLVLNNQRLPGTVNAGKGAFQNATADLVEFHSRWPDAVTGLIAGRVHLERFAEPIHRKTGIQNIVELAA